MRILIVHNDYGKYSGEEAVVDRMVADRRSEGHTVRELRRTSERARDRLAGKIHGFFSGIISLSGRHQMRQALQEFKPDIVHIHNLYPFISPSVLFICKRKGVPVVMTVHNYRLVCPTGMFLRDGRPCENCLRNGNECDCVRYNCEHSRLRSLGYALRNAVARRTGAYRKCVDYYCCLTEFQRQKLVEAGFDSDKMRVFPNYVDFNTDEPYLHKNGLYIGYAGRLSPEKGCDLMIEVARRHPEIPFRLAGLPRDNKPIETPANVKQCGHLDKELLAKFYAQARFIVVPSRCYEGFPMTLLEAATYGCCCLVPDHGPFPEMVSGNCGRLFRPADVDDLERQVVSLWNAPEACETMGQNARHEFGKRYNKKTVNAVWNQFLQQVVDERCES